MGSSGSKTTETTTTANRDPWSGAQAYMTGNGAPGTLPEAALNYLNSGWTNGMQNLATQQGQTVANRTAGQVDQANKVGNGLLSGQYDANVQRVGNIAGASNINAQQVDPTAAFSSMGAANPTSSIQQMLTGQVNTSTLDPVINNASRRLSENFNQSVLPNIRSGATAAGQYGSSRQGIAEGLASQSLGNSMSDLYSNMYNSAYNTAQSNMYGTANNMAGLGLSNAQSNANRDLATQIANASNQLNTQQFNANLGLQNNSQALSQSQQQTNNRLNGLNALQAGNTINDQAYQQQLAALQAGNAYNWSNLANYANIVNGAAGQGGSSSTTTPTYTNNWATGLGLGTSTLGLYSGMKNAGFFS